MRPKTLLILPLGLLLASCSTSDLSALLMEGDELHSSLQTRRIEDGSRHVPAVALPANPHTSTDAEFVEAIARGGSQGRLGSEGFRSALYALYVAENDLGFYGLEAESEAAADRRENELRQIWSHNVSLGRAQIHRAGLRLVVVWSDGVSQECWEAVNAKVAERLAGEAD